jgi:AraC-like DNA-binding protein
LGVDVLTDLLARSRAHSAAFAHTTAHGDWGVAFEPTAGLAVHMLVAGEAHLWADGEPGTATLLLPGDLVIVGHDRPHAMAHAAGAACRPLAEVLATGVAPDSPRRATIGDGPEPAAMFFCGAYLFEGDLCDGLIRAFPDVVHIRPPSASALRRTVDLLAVELLQDEVGQQTLLDRLLDVVLIHVLRDHLAGQGDEAPAWFRAEDDPAVVVALEAMHADPAHPWTVAELAGLAHLSRAAFARRFAAAVGEAPLSYLTEWRMALAREHLRDTDDGLSTIAAAVGYRSEFAFAAAFKRHHDLAPGRWRASVTEARSA